MTVHVWRCYRPQNYVGWELIIAGFGVLTILDVNSDKMRYICCQIVIGMGLGIVWISTQFPILAPLPFSNNAHALSFFTFVRSLSQVILSILCYTLCSHQDFPSQLNSVLQDLGCGNRWCGPSEFTATSTTLDIYIPPPIWSLYRILFHTFHYITSRTAPNAGAQSFRRQFEGIMGGHDRYFGCWSIDGTIDEGDQHEE